MKKEKMSFRIANPGSATWLKELRRALATPGFKVTPPKDPAYFESNYDLTELEKSNMRIGINLIIANASKE